jgi:hypothetical protein
MIKRTETSEVANRSTLLTLPTNEPQSCKPHATDWKSAAEKSAGKGKMRAIRAFHDRSRWRAVTALLIAAGTLLAGAPALLAGPFTIIPQGITCSGNSVSKDGGHTYTIVGEVKTGTNTYDSS